jgi:hypothetical protein
MPRSWKGVLAFSFLVVGTAGVAAVGTAGYLAWRDEVHARASASLPLASSQDDLLRALGEPSWTTDGTRGVEPGFAKGPSQLVDGCVEELWYDTGAAVMPSRWSYCFDASGSLIQKYHWLSW